LIPERDWSRHFFDAWEVRMTIVVRVHGQPTVATVVQENLKSVWVRLADGHVIKRHRTKHVLGVVSG
jgi:hypothetical protein